MKHIALVVTLVGSTLLASGSALAKEKKHVLQEPVTTHTTQAAPEQSYGSSGMSTNLHFGIGFSSFLQGPVAGTTSLDGFVEINKENLLGLNFAILGTTGNFQVMVGPNFRHNLLESHNGALYVGLGAYFGSIKGNFAMAYDGLVGVSYSLESAPNIKFMFEAGPEFQYSSSTSNLVMGASPLLGATIAYMF